jgi:hypothetical protein
MKSRVGSETGAVEIRYCYTSATIKTNATRLTVEAEASAVYSFIAWSARAFVLSVDVDALLIADLTIV